MAGEQHALASCVEYVRTRRELWLAYAPTGIVSGLINVRGVFF
jgi:hypothetical protein